MIKVLVLTKYSRMGASSRLRALQYVPYFRANGFDMEVFELFGDAYLSSLYKTSRRSPFRVVVYYVKRLLVLLKAGKYQAVWIEKELFPFFPAFFERMLRMFGVNYLVDYDDAIFHNYDLSRHRWVRCLLGTKIDKVMKASNLVVVGNEYLAGRARLSGAARVEIVPTVVDCSRYDVALRPEGQQLVIGWIGSPSTQKYVVEIYDALINVCERYGARLKLVGATPDVSSQLPGIEVEVVPWSEESEARLIQQMDVGIMPLNDGPWEKGKCGYKLIQYMACSVPVVASPVGVNVEIVTTSCSGLLAGDNDEWQHALSQLLGNREERARLGSNGRATVETRYSLQAQAPVLEKLLRSIVSC
ncbi:MULTISPECIES: glycosyltransferase family 4 protein [Pseudomonas]|uniref:glycosyltransferase family 4 protein n=1 Tax=Pseudomonas TaxID=286 RepID=UPI000A958F7F|nr:MULTISPECIES: glycosyltransferase family 4 protein [Pseudomonas putida group]